MEILYASREKKINDLRDENKMMKSYSNEISMEHKKYEETQSKLKLYKK